MEKGLGRGELTVLVCEPQKTGKLQLSPIELNEDYREKWQAREKDFVVLTRDDEMINDSLFRVGGLGSKDIEGKKYFMLLKYKEALYDESILKISGNKNPKHLSSHWCIIDNKGVIKFESESSFSNTPYIVDGCIYVVNNNYYNIETGELYCTSYHRCESDNFLFLQNSYDEDKSRRGVMKINKQTGTYEIL